MNEFEKMNEFKKAVDRDRVVRVLGMVKDILRFSEFKLESEEVDAVAVVFIAAGNILEEGWKKRENGETISEGCWSRISKIAGAELKKISTKKTEVQ